MKSEVCADKTKLGSDGGRRGEGRAPAPGSAPCPSPWSSWGVLASDRRIRYFVGAGVLFLTSQDHLIYFKQIDRA